MKLFVILVVLAVGRLVRCRDSAGQRLILLVKALRSSSLENLVLVAYLRQLMMLRTSAESIAATTNKHTSDSHSIYRTAY